MTGGNCWFQTATGGVPRKRVIAFVVCAMCSMGALAQLADRVNRWKADGTAPDSAEMANGTISGSVVYVPGDA